MVRTIAITCVVGLMMCLTAAADQYMTFTFDPNDWVSNYSTNYDIRVNQDNPRLYVNANTEPTDTRNGWHTTYSGASYSSTSPQGYANQLPNVEIHDFNMWLADGINAPNWGEVITQAAGTLPCATAANGWAWEVIDNPWPQPGYGDKLIVWYDVGYWDDDPGTPDNPLTPGGTDFDPFTLTVIANDLDVNGNPVDPFGIHRVWLGTMLPVEWTADPDDLVYANNYRFEGTMNMQSVPVPGAALLGVIGLAVVSRLRRRFA